MTKLVWRVKVVADLGLGAVSETEVARVERDDFAVPETVGLRLGAWMPGFCPSFCLTKVSIDQVNAGLAILAL